MGWMRLLVAVCLAMVVGSTAVNFLDNFDSFGDASHVKVLNNGEQVQLVLDQQAAAGFGSKNQYLFGYIDMQIQLNPGNSAGTVTAYYLSSQGNLHDEMDFEFLGNASGQPVVLQTNVYAQGVGNREQRIGLWFDPSADFHTYSFLWNRFHIIFLVDSIPIRVFFNNEDLGVPYPNKQPMHLYTSIWNGDSWATQGGLVKLNWTDAPFFTNYQRFDGLDGCQVINNDASSCIGTSSSYWWESQLYQTLNTTQTNLLNWVRQHYLQYDYCYDRSRYPSQPPECSRNTI